MAQEMRISTSPNHLEETEANRLLSEFLRSKYKTIRFLFSTISAMSGAALILSFVSESAAQLIFQRIDRYVLILALAAFAIPDLAGRHLAVARRRRLQKSFPDLLGAFLICIESGQSIDQSFKKVRDFTDETHPELHQELTRMTLEVTAGAERSEALNAMALRIGTNEALLFSGIVRQSISLGTPIAMHTRALIKDLQQKRITDAEERANKMPTKMTLATILFTVPPLLAILAGPSLLQIYQLLMNSKP